MTETPDEAGQVSEVARLDAEDIDTPISDSEHVDDVGEETGPDARTGDEHSLKPEESEDD